MEMNKIMKGTALTALAAATLFAAGTTDAAAKEATNLIDANKVTIRTDYQDMLVRGVKGEEIHVGIGTINKNNAVKIAAWDVYENSGYVCVDLSKLNNTKDNYIAVKTESSDPIYIKIPAAVKGQKVTYNPADGIVKIENIKGKETDYKKYEWQYRTSYGSWTYIGNYGWDDETEKETDLPVFEEYQQQGASLYIRAAATDAYDETNKDVVNKIDTKTKVKDASDKSSDATEYPLYESGSFPGKEAKLNIKKQANGPSVSVDYAKNQVKLPKDVEFRMLADSTYYEKDDLKDVSANAKVDVEKFFPVANGKAATSGVLEVRKAADASKKKSASKWTLVKIDNPEAWEFKAKEKKDFDEAGNMVTTSSAVTVESTTGGSISLQYDYKSNKYSGKVKVTNSGNYDFQVIIKSSDPTGTDKAVTIKKSASKSIKANKGDKVYVRKAGDKKEKSFAGRYVSVATLNQ